MTVTYTKDGMSVTLEARHSGVIEERFRNNERYWARWHMSRHPARLAEEIGAKLEADGFTRGPVSP